MKEGGREDLRLPAFALTIFARRLVPLPRWLPIISQWKPSIELFYICWSSYFSYLEIEKKIYIESSIRDSKNKISISLGFRWLVHSWRQHEWSFEKRKRTRRLSETRLEGNLTCRSINKRKNVTRIKNPGAAIPSGEGGKGSRYVSTFSDRSRLAEKCAHRPLPIENVSLVLSSGPAKSRTDLGSSHFARSFVFLFYQYVTHGDRLRFPLPLLTLLLLLDTGYPFFFLFFFPPPRTKFLPSSQEITTKRLSRIIHDPYIFFFFMKNICHVYKIRLIQ